MFRKSVLVFLVSLVFCAGAPAQSVTSLDVDPDYRLGKGDLIEVGVFGVDQFRYSVRVGAAGSITLPYVGEVQASGLTVSELAQRLAERMDGTLFRNPEVLIAVKEFRSNPIILLGSVNRPGAYHDKTGDLKLLDLLAEAGGVTPSAGEFVMIQRGGDDEADVGEVTKLRLDDLFNNGISALKTPVREGDVVTVPAKEREPPPGMFYVVGEVGRPGVFKLPEEKQVFLTQAVASAGGPLRTAKLGKGMLVRYGETGVRQQISVNFKEMLKGKQPDIAIQAKDIIFIPGSSMKTIGYGLLGLIPATIGYAANSTITGGLKP